MLKAKVVQTLIMIVFMKTANPVSICPSDVSFEKFLIHIKNTTNQKMQTWTFNFRPSLATLGSKGATEFFGCMVEPHKAKTSIIATNL